MIINPCKGLMVDLELSDDNKFAAAYTNNNQVRGITKSLITSYPRLNNPGFIMEHPEEMGEEFC